MELDGLGADELAHVASFLPPSSLPPASLACRALRTAVLRSRSAAVPRELHPEGFCNAYPYATSLDLRMCENPVTDELLGALVDHLLGLNPLRGGGAACGEEGGEREDGGGGVVGAGAGAAPPPAIVALNLAELRHLGPGAAPAVARLGRLHTLVLTRCTWLDDKGLSLLAASLEETLTSVDCSCCFQLSDDAAKALCRASRLQEVTARGLRLLTDRGALRLARLPALTSLDVSGCSQITDKTIKGFVRMQHLRNGLQSLRLGSCRELTDAGIGELPALRGLRSLSINWLPYLTVDGMSTVATLTQLTSLSCVGIRGVGEDLPWLEGLAGLRSLDLSDCVAVKRAGIAAIGRRATALETLSLRGCSRVCGADLAELAGCQGLTSLNAAVTGGDLRWRFMHHPSDADMAPALRRLKGLTKLDLARCKAFRGGGDLMLALEGLSSLQSLSLAYALREATSSDDSESNSEDSEGEGDDEHADRVYRQNLTLDSNQFMGFLARSAAAACLTSLDLDGSPLGDEGVAHLAGCQQLESLSLGCCGVLTDKAMETVGGLRGIRYLNLSAMTRLGDVGLGHLSSLPNLRSLILSECTGIQGEALASLPLSLTRLDLSWCTEVRRRHLEAAMIRLSVRGRLNTLDVRQCVAVGGGALDAICSTVTLRHLLVPSCAGVMDEGLRGLTGLTRLETLDLNWCGKVSDETMTVLGKMPSLTSLNISMTKVRDAGATKLQGCNLQELFVGGLELGRETVAGLRAKLPGLVLHGVIEFEER